MNSLWMMMNYFRVLGIIILSLSIIRDAFIGVAGGWMGGYRDELKLGSNIFLCKHLRIG